MSILECHSKGDRRFSALYAHLSFGKSIEWIYQDAKRGENGEHFLFGKGKRPVFFQLGEHMVDATAQLRWNFYALLWKWYFDTYPGLVEFAAYHDGFRDIFDGKRGCVYTLPMKSYPVVGTEQDRCCQSQAIAWLAQNDNQLDLLPIVQQYDIWARMFYGF